MLVIHIGDLVQLRQQFLPLHHQLIEVLRICQGEVISDSATRLMKFTCRFRHLVVSIGVHWRSSSSIGVDHRSGRNAVVLRSSLGQTFFRFVFVLVVVRVWEMRWRVVHRHRMRWNLERSSLRRKIAIHRGMVGMRITRRWLHQRRRSLRIVRLIHHPRMVIRLKVESIVRRIEQRGMMHWRSIRRRIVGMTREQMWHGWLMTVGKRRGWRWQRRSREMTRVLSHRRPRGWIVRRSRKMMMVIGRWMHRDRWIVVVVVVVSTGLMIVVIIIIVTICAMAFA